jgi:hypothetical protein
MSARVWFLTAVALLIMLVNTQRLPSQDDVADISSQDLRANKVSPLRPREFRAAQHGGLAVQLF